MVAAEFGGAEGGFTPEAGVASAVTKACAARNMLLLTAGTDARVLQAPHAGDNACHVNPAA